MQLEHIPWSGKKPPKQEEAKRVLEAEGFDVVCWNDPAGRVYAAHHHERDESLWMIAGAMTFTIAGRDYRLQAGDRLILPRGVVHGARTRQARAT
jgi:quercetin dioxygenase-like cupin family protein